MWRVTLGVVGGELDALKKTKKNRGGCFVIDVDDVSTCFTSASDVRRAP